MGLEAATYIGDLDPLWPLEGDLLSEADDHLRLLKSTLQATFPNAAGAYTLADDDIVSDGAGNLTIAGTLSVVAAFGADTLLASSDNPSINLYDESVARTADNIQWQWINTNEELILRPLSDVGGASDEAIKLTRTLNNIDALIVSADGMTFQASGGGGMTANFTGNIDVSGALYHGDGNQNLNSSGTQSILSGGLTTNGDILSDATNTDSLGSTGVRWLKGWFNNVTAGGMTLGSGSIVDTTGQISFGNENLVTTGTLASGSLTVTGDITVDSLVQPKIKVVDIGDWNMDTTASLNVAHGLTVGDIRSVSVLIRTDAGSSAHELGYTSAIYSNIAAGSFAVTATVISMVRIGSNKFDSTTYDSTSYNRGWITIKYV